LLFVVRGLAGWFVTDWLVLRGGVVAGGGASFLKSTGCGEHNLWRPVYGLSAGPGVRLGERYPIDIALHAEAVQGPHLTCVNGLLQLPHPWPALREDDDAGLSAVLRVSSLWW
jgi:hypothetical protein